MNVSGLEWKEKVSVRPERRVDTPRGSSGAGLEDMIQVLVGLLASSFLSKSRMSHSANHAFHKVEGVLVWAGETGKNVGTRNNGRIRLCGYVALTRATPAAVFGIWNLASLELRGS